MSRQAQDPDWVARLEAEKDRRSFTYIREKVYVSPEKLVVAQPDGERRFDRSKSNIVIKRITRRAFYPTAIVFYLSLGILIASLLAVVESPSPQEPEGLEVITLHSLPLIPTERLANRLEDAGLNVSKIHIRDVEYREYMCPVCGIKSASQLCEECGVPTEPTGRVEILSQYAYHIRAGPKLQIAIIVTALILLFQPTVLSLVLHPATSAVVSASLHMCLYLAGPLTLPTLVFLKIEDLYGNGWAPFFYSALAISLIAAGKMLSQTMRAYSVTFQQGDEKVSLRWANPEGAALASHLKGRTSIEAHIWRHLYRFLALGRLAGSRQKQCYYCQNRTLTECLRCFKPICSRHTAKLKGYKVCLECFIERRGKRRPSLR